MTTGATAGDLDGDGRPEIIFNCTMRSWSQMNPDLPLYVYLGSDSHEYDPRRRLELPTGGTTNTYVLADLDLDGYPDLAFVSPEGLRIFHGGPEGLRADRYSVVPGGGRLFGCVLTADLNRDGWPDLLPVAHTLLRWAQTEMDLDNAPWQGPGGAGSAYETPGTPVRDVPADAAVLQYRATFVAQNGCLSPKLREVTVELSDAPTAPTPRPR